MCANVHDNASRGIGFGGVEEFGDGILVLDSGANRIFGNTVARNGPYGGITLALPGSDLNVVNRNTVRDNDLPDLCSAEDAQENPEFCEGGVVGAPTFNEDFGIKVEGPGAERNVITGNSVTGSGVHGVGVTPTCPDFGEPDFTCAGPLNADNLVRGNHVNRNGFGVAGFGGSGIFLFSVGEALSPVRTTIEGNTANDNAAFGINVDCRSTGNVVLGNTALGNGDFDLRDGNVSTPPDSCPTAPPECDRNRWADNRFVTFNHPCVTGRRLAGGFGAERATGSVSSATGRQAPWAPRGHSRVSSSQG